MSIYFNRRLYVHSMCSAAFCFVFVEVDHMTIAVYLEVITGQ